MSACARCGKNTRTAWYSDPDWPTVRYCSLGCRADGPVAEPPAPAAGGYGVKAESFWPTKPAARFHTILELVRDKDPETGEPIEPVISKEQARALLDAEYPPADAMREVEKPVDEWTVEPILLTDYANVVNRLAAETQRANNLADECGELQHALDLADRTIGRLQRELERARRSK